MKKSLSFSCRFLSLALFFWATAACAGELDPQAPLPVDPQIRMGVLPNGMAFWIREHKTPPGKVGIWMHVGSGSLNEDDPQRGLAHYLEHMAFNGSEHFPAGTLVKYFEALGLRFGQHQNAFTSFDQTTYMLQLPDPKEETIGKGLQCLADFAFRLSLGPEEIEKERGVILEEARSRKGAQQRLLEKLLPVLAPGSRFAERMPIGKEETVKAAGRKVIQDYYAKWYRPDLTTLLIAGEIDPAAAERLVRENFSAWKAVEHPATSADPGIRPYTSARAAVLTDPELTETEVNVAGVKPLQKCLTVGELRQRLLNDLAAWILNRRFEELIQKGVAPFQKAEAGVGPFLNVCTYSHAEATGKPERWEPMLRALLVELKRAREHGFLAQEFEDAKKETLASAEQAARQESTRDAHVFLGRMNSAVAEFRKPSSSAQQLELYRALLPSIKLDEVAAAFRGHFALEARLLLITMPEKKDLPVPSAEAVLALAAQVEAEKVDALAAKERPTSLLEAEPAPGQVVRQEEEPGLKILSVTFENGARVHLRQMDFKKDQVLARITLAGGALREQAENRGVTSVAGLALGQPATEKLSSIAIRDLLTGKKVSVGGSAGEDALSLSIQGSPQDLEEGFRLAHLLLQRAHLEDSALNVWKPQMLQYLERAKVSVEAQLQEHAAVLLSGQDPRHRQVTPAQVERLTREEGQRWLDAALQGAPIEAAIVGDLPRDQALELARKYLGSLPPRAVRDEALEKLRALKRLPGPLEENVEVDTITDRAVVLVGWRGAGWKDVKDRRILQFVSQILTARLREEIREKRALTYSISCFARPGQAYPDLGLLAAFCTADPAKAAEAARLTREAMEGFAKEGPTEEEMATTRKQLKNALETQLKEPSYWVSVLADLDYRGTKLSDVKELIEKITSYTREEVMEVTRRYVTEERRIQVIATPKAKAKGETKEEKKP